MFQDTELATYIEWLINALLDDDAQMVDAYARSAGRLIEQGAQLP